MAHVAETIEIHATLEKVFPYAVSHKNAAKFIASVTSYDPTTEASRGVGARFAMGISILDFRFTQELEVVDLQLGRFLHVRSLSGQPLSDAKWSFEPTIKGTQVTYEISYELPDMFLGRKIDETTRKKLDIQIQADVSQTLTNLKDHLEAS